MSKTVTCEVLSTIKGLDPKFPKEYIHPGTADDPKLVDLPNNAATAALANSGVIRVYPGQKPVQQLGESDKVRALQEKLAKMEKAFHEAAAASEQATEDAKKLAEALKQVQEATSLESAIEIATGALEAPTAA